jgi:hypothetical protein
MDNHKDFIHIDDLFKKLKDGEEPEPSGAWLRMKDMLDKELPVGTAIATSRSWKRYLLPLLGLFMAGGGGYAYYQHQVQNRHESHTVVSSNSTANATVQNKVPQPAGSNSLTSLPLDNDKNLSTEVQNKTILPSTTQGKNQSIVQNSPKIKSTPAASLVSNGRSVSEPVNINNRQKANSLTGVPLNSDAVSHNNKKVTTKALSTQDIDLASFSNTDWNKTMQETTIANISTEEHILGATNTVSAINDSKITPIVASVNSVKKSVTLPPNMPPFNGKKVVADDNNALYEERKDTFTRINVAEQTQWVKENGKSKLKVKVDTLGVAKVARVQYIPLQPLEIGALQKQVLLASKPTVSNSNINRASKTVKRELFAFKPLSSYKVSSKQSEVSKFNTFMENTSRGISDYLDGGTGFYTTLFAGANINFGQPSAYGIQLGLSGFYQIMERLSISAELRYTNRFINNFSLDDKSVEVNNVSSTTINNSEWLFSGDQSVTQSKYQLNNFSTLDVPVMMHYNLGRLNVMGGMFASYAMPMKYTLVNQVQTISVQKNATSNTNPFTNVNGAISADKDFNSRFGMGYTFGLSYDFSRKISLEARMSHMIWDNSSSANDAIKRLYHIPSFQLSLGYSFGKREKVMYIMDRK